jgi:D-hexose-6-phosphate mutarotase
MALQDCQIGTCILNLRIEQSFIETADSITLTLSLNQSSIPQSQREKWSFQFDLYYTIVLTNQSLTASLKVVNKDTINFQFQALLHAYFNTSTRTVKGLQNCPYTQFNIKSKQDGILKIEEEVDRVYEGVGQIVLDDILISRSSSLPQVVIGNPWIEKARGMVDFGDDEVIVY